MSDHFCVTCTLDLKTMPLETKTVSFRKIKDINIDDLRFDLRATLGDVQLTQDPDNLVKCYDTALRSVLDKHAPMQTKTVVLKSKSPWYDNDLQVAKQARRRHERAYHKNPTPDNMMSYKSALSSMNRMLRKKKEEYYTTKISTNAGNPKQLFKIVKEIANTQATVSYPTATSNKVLADDFATYFKEKINRISDDLDSVPVPPSMISIENNLSSNFSAFTPLTPAQLKKYILASPSKACPLDPLPTTLLRECLSECLTIMVHIVNTSLEKGYMPKALKRAIITPVPKKPNIPEYTNFRPISNLPFLSKLIERVVVAQLTQYCEHNSLNEPLQRIAAVIRPKPLY